MADLELYIDPKGVVYVGGKEVLLSGAPLHASMADMKFKRHPVWKMLAPEWIRLMQLWSEVYPAVQHTVYNVAATKEKTRKEGYVTVNIFVNTEGEPKARLRWGPERPPTRKQIWDDLMPILDLIRYDLRIPAVFEELEGHFSLGAVVKNRTQAEQVVAYLDDILERNYPYVFKSLIVV